MLNLPSRPSGRLFFYAHVRMRKIHRAIVWKKSLCRACGKSPTENLPCYHVENLPCHTARVHAVHAENQICRARHTQSLPTETFGTGKSHIVNNVLLVDSTRNIVNNDLMPSLGRLSRPHAIGKSVPVNDSMPSFGKSPRPRTTCTWKIGTLKTIPCRSSENPPTRAMPADGESRYSENFHAVIRKIPATIGKSQRQNDFVKSIMPLHANFWKIRVTYSFGKSSTCSDNMENPSRNIVNNSVLYLENLH